MQRFANPSLKEIVGITLQDKTRSEGFFHDPKLAM